MIAHLLAHHLGGDSAFAITVIAVVAFALWLLWCFEAEMRREADAYPLPALEDDHDDE